MKQDYVCQNLQVVFLQQQTLIYGCVKVHMIYLLLLLILWDLIDNLNELLLVCLRL
jgi:hypothetical protein